MRLPIAKTAQHNKAFTLLEVVIALALLAVTSVAFTSGLVYSARTAKSAKTDVFAIEVINKIIEELRSSDYDRLGGSTGAEAKFLAPLTYYQDPDVPRAQTTTFTANVRFFGFGTITNATGNTLTAAFPSGSAWPAWRPNMFAGRFVMITSGTGRGQIAYIQSNTANTMTISRALDGTGSQSWIQTPSAGAGYCVDNGKIAEITVTWSINNRAFTMTRMAMIPSFVASFN